MSKILKDTDVVSLIKTGTKYVYTEIQDEVTQLNDNIDKVDNDISTYTSETGYKAFFDIRRTGKIYQTKIPKYTYNPSPVCTKTLDNVGLTCIPSTATVENTDDYEDIPLFKWYRCNYIRDNYGNPTIQTLSDCEDFSTSEDVGTFGMSFYWSYLDGVDYNDLDSNYYYLTISDSPNDTWHLQLWVGCKDNNGNDMGYWLYSTYYSNIDYKSLPNQMPVTVNSMEQAYLGYTTKKGSGYQGCSCDRVSFMYIFYLIKYANKAFSTYLNSTSVIMNTGSTDSVIGHHDGYIDNSSPSRMQGIETGMCGLLYSNVIIYDSNNVRHFKVASKGTNWVPNSSSFVLLNTTSNVFNYIGDVIITNEGLIVPITSANSSSTGTGDIASVYDSTGTISAYCNEGGFTSLGRYNFEDIDAMLTAD